MRHPLRFGSIFVFALVCMASAACGIRQPADTTEAQGSSAGRTTKVGMTHDVSTGRGDRSFNDAASSALDRIHAALHVVTEDLFAVPDETAAGMRSRLDRLASDGFNPIVAVGFAYADALAEVAPKHPKTRFAIVDSAVPVGPNVTNLIFAEEQGAFLVGAIAALKSSTNEVGYIGGVKAPLLDKFEAGFKAGVAEADPEVDVEVRYLSQPPDFSGFNSAAEAKRVAEGMFAAGADVIFVAAGSSGAGVLQSARGGGRKAIGITYGNEQAELAPGALTNMVKRVDHAVYAFAKDTLAGKFTAGTRSFDLQTGGVGYTPPRALMTSACGSTC